LKKEIIFTFTDSYGEMEGIPDSRNLKKYQFLPFQLLILLAAIYNKRNSQRETFTAIT